MSEHITRGTPPTPKKERDGLLPTSTPKLGDEVVSCGHELDVGEVLRRAEPFTKCTVPWSKWGYGGLYTCLDREVDIAHPEHPTRDWFPRSRPCDGCELARAVGRRGKGTLTPAEERVKRREEIDRREFKRLSAKFATAPADREVPGG